MMAAAQETRARQQEARAALVAATPKVGTGEGVDGAGGGGAVYVRDSGTELL